ncbi:5816_t:CDS:2, partial [Ambispora leptoticha]
PQTRSTDKVRSDSMTSAESTETIEAPGRQDVQDSQPMENMQQFMNQQAEIQREWTTWLIETINQRFTEMD